MKKAILIEDRTLRQQAFEKDRGFCFKVYEDVLENAIDEKYSTLYSELKEDLSVLEPYHVIIVHKSAFGDDSELILKRLEEYVKQRDKKLILFSGAIDTSYYDGILMEINSKRFYHDNLKLFLDALKTDRVNPLLINYGKKWKINIALEVLERVNIFFFNLKDDEVRLSRFRQNTKIEKLDSIGLRDVIIDIKGSFITKDEIRSIKKRLKKAISKEIIYG